MSSDSTLPETIPVQDSSLKSKLLPNLVISTPSKCAKETIACIVILIILAMSVIPVIVFSIQIQNEKKFESILMQKIQTLELRLDQSSKTIFSKLLITTQ